MEMSSGNLFESFANDTPTYEAHQNIIVSLRSQPCSNVHSVHADERCLFVQETEHCRESAQYIDYMHFMYCVVDSSNVILFSLAVIGLLLTAVAIASVIYTICVHRYVDGILYVAKSLHLNEYIAGVTLLTYGNGLPQVVYELKHHTSGDTELIYNQYLGTAVYQTSFLAALVISMRRFYIYPEVIVPSIITLLTVAALAEPFMYKEHVGIVETIALFALYVIFLAALYTISLALDRPGNRSRTLFTVFAASYLVMLLIYEMVAILETLSIISKISSASFVITILSWGNCWIDLVTCITLAKRGYPRLAFAACLGGPVFNILIGLCTVFCVQMIRTGSTTIHVRDGTSGPTCAAYLFMIALTLLISVLFSRFQARASLAFCLFTLYVTFVVYIVFCEFEITHGYGTDHNDDREYFLDKIPHHRR
uniref:Sodium/calcium exchanger membrane region domain-containing protein n=1 Tax=Anopheles atroparvus TaxID=41427 RepID=A0A182J7G6_ANOAO